MNKKDIFIPKDKLDEHIANYGRTNGSSKEIKKFLDAKPIVRFIRGWDFKRIQKVRKFKKK